MKKIQSGITLFAALFLLVFSSGTAFAWHDKTHMAISQAAGYENWYNSAAPDVAKTKAGDTEATNHWYNADAKENVTVQMVQDQVGRYNNPADAKGHLYGAIIASLNAYKKEINNPIKYAEYHMAFCAHYIGDLSMPLHSMSDGDFNNRERHPRYDDTIEFSVLNNIGLIQKNMYEFKIQSDEDLARQIARVANISHQLALKLEKEVLEKKRKDAMTQDEAYAQVAHSASLLKAALTYAKAMK